MTCITGLKTINRISFMESPNTNAKIHFVEIIVTYEHI